MTLRQSTFEGAFGISLIASTVVHLAFFLLLIWSGRLFPATPPAQETYYVDVVNLPVASPRAGSPTQQGDDLEAPPPPALEKDMALPAPRSPETRPKVPPPTKLAEKVKADTESDAFAEKMAKLQGKSDDQQQQAVLEQLRRKVAASGSGRTGMPGARGTEAGSRYEDYLKSRLEDALKITSSYSTKNPVVDVHLTIGTNGRITRQKIERSSGDHTFELAVQRAIEIAGEALKPPPNQKVFEGDFKFMPREIAKTKP